MELICPSGKQFEVYPSGDEGSPRAVLIVHDWWGVKPYNHDWAARLNAAGCYTLVVDLYDGEQPRNSEAASARMRDVDQEDADEKLATALRLLSRPGRRIGLIGWSFGGLQAQLAALNNPGRVAALAVWYCRMVMDDERWEGFGGRVLALYAEGERTWLDKQERFAGLMQRLGIDYEGHSYPAGHGFVNPDSERFDPVARDESRELAVRFMVAGLG